jgi:hypothetical protein
MIHNGSAPGYTLASRETRPVMDAYKRVYEALDVALASGERAVAPGTEATVQTALAELRAHNGPAEAVARLEAISVDLALLNSALRTGNPDECLVRRARLTAIKDEWLRSAPLH